jgi:16S rRNA (uracil1498-N3)-methyltransferase
MTRPRFHLDAELTPGVAVLLPAAVTHHAARVLRLRDGAAITAFNGRGGEWRCRLEVEGARAWAVPEDFDPVERESPLQLALVQAWVASDKLEWMVEKAVELGVTELILVPAARSVIQLDEPRRQRRLTRLHEIVTAACCQSGRNRVPGVTSTTSLERGLSAALAAGSRGLLLDPHATETLPDDLLRSSGVAVAIGPEGGFDEAEHALAVRLGYRPTRLGPRILRTETAGIAALAALQMLGGGLR